MPNELRLTGFAELRAELAALPESLKRDSRPIEQKYARSALAQVVSTYPYVSGGLRAGVKIVDRVARGVATLLTLVSGSPHAHLYEFGTVHQRPRPTFLPITARERRAATAEVADLVRASGLVVRGDHD